MSRYPHVNITVSAEVLADAKKSGINISRIAEAALVAEVDRIRSQTMEDRLMILTVTQLGALADLAAVGVAGGDFAINKETAAVLSTLRSHRLVSVGADRRLAGFELTDDGAELAQIVHSIVDQVKATVRNRLEQRQWMTK